MYSVAMCMKYLTLLILLTWISNSNSLLRFSDENDINSVTVDVEITEGRRTRRSIDNTLHPHTYDLDLEVEGLKVHLHLTRNDKLITSVPTLTLERGVLTKLYLDEQEKSVFYQDFSNGAAFVVQDSETEFKNMFGIFHNDNNEYRLQNQRSGSINLRNGRNAFDIVRKNIADKPYGDDLQDNVQPIKKTVRKRLRQKRATGNQAIELLVVCDYAVYKYWYDKSTKQTTTERQTEAETSIRQFYAFVINGMDAMYKNIQTSSYTISVVFAGIVIAKTQGDATWTENIQIGSTVSASQGLQNFKTWVAQNSNSLPGSDHAMLFTRYDLTSGGSNSIAGLASVDAICSASSQSIVEDKFDFVMITTSAHELGHSLSAAHDGTGNICSSLNAYIMAPSSSPQQGTTADHPWKFSSCSTSYFTNKINSLDLNNNNCMKTFSSTYNPNGLYPYDQVVAGQVYTADQQCQNIYGASSYMCRGQYNNDYSSICSLLWCKNPAGNDCRSAVAGEGTLCGNKKWCESGVCRSNSNAPSGNDACLYGDAIGQVFSNGWTCAQMVIISPINCPAVSEKCCYSCNPSQTTTSSSTTPSTTRSPTTLSPVSTSTLSSTPESSSDFVSWIKSNLTIVIGAASALVFIVVVVLIVVCVACCRKQNTKQKQSSRRGSRNKNNSYRGHGYDNPVMVPNISYIKHTKHHY